MCPIAHVPHCPCAPLPMWPIPPVSIMPYCPCAPYPLYPIPRTPCGPYWPCTTLPLWVSLPMYPIPLYPTAHCVPIAHRPHCRCDPYPMYTIALIIYWGTGVMGHMGNGAHGAIVYRGYGVQGYGPWGTWVMGQRGCGPHGH